VFRLPLRWATPVAVWLLAGATAAAVERPDIVLILADDLGYADVGFTGGREIKTPHLDRLAAAGAVLKQFYVQPVCSPTRAALMTGRYPMRHGLQVGVIRPWDRHGLPLDERTLPQALREAGYTTVATGKWHLGSFDRAYWPTSRGFDHHYGHLFGAIDYYAHVRDGKPDWYRDGQALTEPGYSTHLLAREAVRTIEAQPRDRPLFLYVAFNAPHVPLQVPERYTQPYAGLAEPRRTYAGMLAAMDEAVGQIARAIDDSGRRNRTLFAFSSDNGGPEPGRMTDNRPFRGGKGTLYEGGVRVSAFMTWPGRIAPGLVVDAPMHIVDWYPTMLARAGASLRQRRPLDGRDVWPTITGGRPSPHDAILLNAAPRTGAIRLGDWKLVLNGSVAVNHGELPPGVPRGVEPVTGPPPPPERLELFNLRDDPSETNDLAATHGSKVRELRARYDRLARQAAPPKNVR
jgi:arylsulfatase A-like enzyme